jgi:hypothetical protein
MQPTDILAAIESPEWWGPWFARGDWRAWRALLAAAFALPMDEEQLAVYRECTGRSSPPTSPASEVWAICGRRGGKSRVMATVAAFIAAFIDWRSYLAPGEVATVQVIAKDRKQARTAMRYLRSLFLEHPTLKKLVERDTDEALELTCRVVIEITTASFRSARGYTVVAVLADEVAFWIDDEDSANPAEEIIDALRPAMATMPGALLMVATSPYARRGPVWEAFRRYHGKDGDILVWRAPTRRMNPLVPQKVIDAAYQKDPASASAEYGAEFRTDVETFVSREVVDAAVAPGRYELPRAQGAIYYGFADAAGGSGGDSFTAAVAHLDRATDRLVVDAVREHRPPFSPEATIEELAEFFKSYGVRRITCDRWGGEFPREQFRKHGIDCTVSERVKSDIYKDFLPFINSGKVELLDLSRLVSQLCALERRTARGGKDSIDHAPGAHDDVINSVAGALVLASSASLIKITPELLARAARPPRKRAPRSRMRPAPQAPSDPRMIIGAPSPPRDNAERPAAEISAEARSTRWGGTRHRAFVSSSNEN